MYFPTFLVAASSLGVAKALTMISPYDLASFTPTASPGTSPCMETSSPSLTSADPEIKTIFTTTTLLDSDATAPLNHATMPRPTTLNDSDSTTSFCRATMSTNPQPTRASQKKPTPTAQPAETSEAPEDEEHEKPWAIGFKKNLPAFIVGMVILVFGIILIGYMLIKSRLRARRNPEVELEAQRH